MYSFLRSLLFKLEAERSHDIVMSGLSWLSRHQQLARLAHLCYGNYVPSLPTKLMGLSLRHPIGLAAGLDKHATAGHTLTNLGFAWVESGTVTPKAQPGNLSPRLFRVPKYQTIINRMGFNSVGLDTFIENLSLDGPMPVTGINIGKNASTPIDKAFDDYRVGMTRVYEIADYITINISSPNTDGLREIQTETILEGFLCNIDQCRQELRDRHQKNTPIVLKIAPDLHDDDIAMIATLLRRYRIDGLIATNTTISRPAYVNDALLNENGGLSGEPLRQLSTDVIRKFYQHLQGEIPIIGAGGIFNSDDAWDKLCAGAHALQIYTGFIYKGPKIVRDIVRGLKQRVIDSNCENLPSALQLHRYN